VGGVLICSSDYSDGANSIPSSMVSSSVIILLFCCLNGLAIYVLKLVFELFIYLIFKFKLERSEGFWGFGEQYVTFLLLVQLVLLPVVADLGYQYLLGCCGERLWAPIASGRPCGPTPSCRAGCATGCGSCVDGRHCDVGAARRRAEGTQATGSLSCTGCRAGSWRRASLLVHKAHAAVQPSPPWPSRR
jgi:hypothetical protein